MLIREGERRLRALEDSMRQSYIEFMASWAVRETLRRAFEEPDSLGITAWENEGGR
jgi:hypothetical protein